MSRIALGLVVLLAAVAMVWGASLGPSAVSGRAVPYWDTAPQAGPEMFARCVEKSYPGTGPYTLGPALDHAGALTVVGRSADHVVICHQRGTTISSGGVPADPGTPWAHSFDQYGMISDPDGTRVLAYGPTPPEVAAVDVLGPAGQVQHAQVSAGAFLAPVPWMTTREAERPTFRAFDARGNVLYESS